MNEQTAIAYALACFPEYRWDMAFQVVGLPESWIIASSLHSDVACATDGYKCNLLRVVQEVN